MADRSDKPTLLQVLKPWPITISVVESLQISDLIKLSRVNSDFRALLHNFEATEHPRNLHIGQHQTIQWRMLKQSAIWVCGSPNHDTGGKISYCRHCSDPICEACMVRDSMSKRWGKTEQTLRNRWRYICRDCWSSETPHRGRKFIHNPFAAPTAGSSGHPHPIYNFAPGEGEHCACTSADCFVCLPCKTRQNAAITSGEAFRYCCGENCSNSITNDPEKDRRRVCLWCDRPLMRSRASIESKQEYDQQLFNIRIALIQEERRQQEEHRRNQEALRQSRDRNRVSRRMIVRSLQQTNPDHVRDHVAETRRAFRDSTVDKLQFLRYLDVVNYRQLGAIPPDPKYVTQPRQGKFRYDRIFLMQFQSLINGPPPRDMIDRANDIAVSDTVYRERPDGSMICIRSCQPLAPLKRKRSQPKDRGDQRALDIAGEDEDSAKRRFNPFRCPSSSRRGLVRHRSAPLPEENDKRSGGITHNSFFSIRRRFTISLSSSSRSRSRSKSLATSSSSASLGDDDPDSPRTYRLSTSTFLPSWLVSRSSSPLSSNAIRNVRSQPAPSHPPLTAWLSSRREAPRHHPAANSPPKPSTPTTSYPPLSDSASSSMPTTSRNGDSSDLPPAYEDLREQEGPRFLGAVGPWLRGRRA